MPVVVRARNFTISVYFKDHGGKHAHVMTPGGKAKIYLDGRVESFQGMTRKDLKIAIQLVIQFRDVIEEKWDEYQNT